MDNNVGMAQRYEHERIRKEIIEYFHGCIRRNRKTGFRVEQIKGWIAYLEKQKEHKPEEKISVSEELYEHIRNTCACIDDAMSSDTMCDMTDYLTMADSSAQKAFDMVERLVVNKPTECSEEEIVNWLKENFYVSSFDNTKIVTKFSSMDDLIKSVRERLKSLRPQPNWKPSEEQMEALANALSLAKNCGEESSFYLRTLLNDLKKL